jgi:PST family polysaccharide transporter
VAWTAAAKWTVQIFTWLTSIVVARLLSPDDYGLVGMAGVFLGVIRIFSEFGLGVTVVTLRDLSEETISQLNAVALIIGVAACGITVLAARPLAAFFESDRLVLVLAALSVGFVISSLRIVPAALLQRDLRFKRLATVEAISATVLSVAMISFAMWGFGYWTLVVGNLLSITFSSVAILLQRRVAFSLPRPRALTSSLQLSRHQLIGSLFWYSYTNADFLIAGKILGERTLGLYSMAWSLSKSIPERITGLIIGVTPAYFSAVQDNLPELRRYFLKITEAIAIITFPALVGLALTADLLETVLLGPRWAGIAAPLRLLALYAALSSVTPLFSRVLTARRHTRFLMWNGFYVTLILCTGFWVGSRWGILGIAAAWLILDPPIQFVVLLKTCRVIDLPIAQYVKALWPALSMTGLMSLVLLLVLPLVESQSPPLRVVIAVVSGMLAYATAGFVLHRSRLLGMFRIMRGGFQSAP